jgi:type VI secretion system protein ImpA
MLAVQTQKPAHVDSIRLLKHVSSASPAGEDLRYSGVYDEIRDARREDDASLSRGVWVAPLKRAHWDRVQDLCISALEKQSKDVQIGVWLVEAWVRLNGFRGLSDGLRFLTDLCAAFWDDLFPKLDGDDPDYRLAPFVWLNEKLPVEVRMVSITQPDSDDAKPYSWADWEAVRNGEEPDSSANCASLAVFQQSVMLTPAEFYSALYADLDGCVEACGSLRSILEGHCGAESPTLGQISRTVSQIRDFIGDILEQRHIPRHALDAAPDECSPQSPTAGPETRPAGREAHPGAIRSRSEAYRRLAEAADYLATTEPHSPAPYLIRRAIRWGSLPLEELLPELVRNQDELSEIFRLLQIREP